MILPNVVIAGTPKSGSSSLFRWLGDHPQVCASLRKETRFLLDPGRSALSGRLQLSRSRTGRLGETFPESCRSSLPVRLEATPHYLYHETARNVLAGLDEPPHIVILLRKPSDRIHSSFRYTQNNLGLLPRRMTFGEYVATLFSEESLSADEFARRPLVWRELRYSRYAEYLSRWQEAFPAERLHVMIFEEFMGARSGRMVDLADRIGLEGDFYREYPFPRFNETYSVRSPELQRSARRLSRLLPAGRIKAAARQMYLKLQRRPQKAATTTDDQDALRRLDDYFAPANARLAELLGRDLTVWEPSTATSGGPQRESLGTGTR